MPPDKSGQGGLLNEFGEGDLLEEPEAEPEMVDSEKDVWIVAKGFKGMIGEDISELDSVITTDSLHIVLDSRVATDTPEGYLEFKQIVLAREMVQDYDGKQVLKPADELRKILDHGENRHITDEHPVGGTVTSIKERKGFIRDLSFTDSNELCGDMVIVCPILIDAIRNGSKREVSIGFRADTDITAGMFNDSPYTEIQRNMLLDHVAVTTHGRCSRKDGCGIHKLDSVVKTAVPHTSVLTDSQIKSLKKADDIIARQRVDMIAVISAANPNVNRTTLDSMPFNQLEQTIEILKTATNVPSAGIHTDRSRDQNKSSTDIAYEKVGKNGGQ